MRIYLAAAFGRRQEMRSIALRLIDLGHAVTSRWIWDDKDAADNGTDCPLPHIARVAAADDLDDIDAAQLVISFTQERDDLHSRGGRHAEFGYALKAGKQLWLVGEAEHIFHTVLRVQLFPSLDAVLQRLSMYACDPAEAAGVQPNL